MAVLIPKDVLTINKHLANGLSHSKIAARIGCSKSAVGDISKGKRWSYLRGLEPSDLPLMKALLDDGMSPTEIAEKFEVPRYALRKLWPDDVPEPRKEIA